MSYISKIRNHTHQPISIHAQALTHPYPPPWKQISKHPYQPKQTPLPTHTQAHTPPLTNPPHPHSPTSTPIIHTQTITLFHQSPTPPLRNIIRNHVTAMSVCNFTIVEYYFYCILYLKVSRRVWRNQRGNQNRISKTDREKYGQKIKYRRTNNDLQNIHIKLKTDRVTRTTVYKTYTNYTSVQNVYHNMKLQLPSFSEITYVQLPTMAELLTQHIIASTHPVRFLNTIEVIKSDF
jgi:hypothetical protein